MRLWFLVTLHGLLLLAPGTVAAQATPEASACSVAPLAPQQLEEIVEDGFEPAPELIAADQPAPASATLEIFLAVSQSIECANANDPLRSLALFTDRYLAERFSGDTGADELGHLLAAATRTPVPASPEDRLVLLGVGQPVLYEDGRISVIVTTANAESTFTDLLIFANVDDAWRIDQVVLDAGAEATPSADG